MPPARTAAPPNGNGGRTIGGTAPARTSRAPKSIQQLAAMELKNTPDWHGYLSGARGLCLMLGQELEGAATQVEKRMSEGKGRWQGLVTRAMARRATRRVHKAASNVVSAGNDLARAWTDYARQFEELRNPDRKTGWDFRDNPGKK